MAMTEARQKRLAANVIRRGIAVEAERKVSKNPGELARAQLAYENSHRALNDAESLAFEAWEAEGPPMVDVVEADVAIDYSTGGIRRVPVPAVTSPAGDVTEWKKDGREIQVKTTTRRRIDYSAFGERAGLVERAWNARAFYFALATDQELYKLYWRRRGGCRGESVNPDTGEIVNMGALRDELSGLRAMKREERTPEVDAFILALERALLQAEYWHEAPLRASRKWHVKNGRAATDGEESPDVCKHCRGTGIIRPSHDAPASLVSEWRELANKNANRRFFAMEAIRRGSLGHGIALTYPEDGLPGGGAPRMGWAEYRKTILEPFSRNAPGRPAGRR